MTRRAAAIAALFVALLALPATTLARRTPTKAAPAPPPAEKPESQPGFWGRVAHPHQQRYDELTTQGRALYEQEKPGLAIDVLAEAVRLDPARPDAWWFLGVSYQRLDRFGECADALQHVMDLAPGGWVPAGARAVYPEPAFSLALCDAVAGRLDASVALLEQALGKDDLSIEVTATLTYNLGDSYHALGRLEDAIRAYQQAIELKPNLPLYRFSLAVALDRDEQGARAREEMLTALAGDRSMASISQPNTVFVPPEDEDYFRGFALEVLAASDVQKSACQPWMCRALARVYFRRFQARAPQSPWHERASVHLHDLGGAAPGPEEISVLLWSNHNEAAAPAPYQKAVVSVVPRLQACLAGKPLALLRVDLVLPGKGNPAPPRPAPGKPGKPIAQPVPRPVASEKTFSVQSGGPVPVDEASRACVVGVLTGLHWPGPAAGPVRVQFAVSAP